MTTPTTENTIFAISFFLNNELGKKIKYQSLRRHIQRRIEKDDRFLMQFGFSIDDVEPPGKDDVLTDDQFNGLLRYFIEHFSDEPTVEEAIDAINEKASLRIYKNIEPEAKGPYYGDKSSEYKATKKAAERLDHFNKFGPGSYPKDSDAETEKGRGLHITGIPEKQELDESLIEKPVVEPIDKPTIKSINFDPIDFILSSKFVKFLLALGALYFQAKIFGLLLMRTVEKLPVEIKSDLNLDKTSALIIGLLFDLSAIFLAYNLEPKVKISRYDTSGDARNTWIWLFFILQLTTDGAFFGWFGDWSLAIGKFIVGLSVPVTIAAFTVMFLKKSKS